MVSPTSTLHDVDGEHHAPAALPQGNGTGTSGTTSLVGFGTDLDGCGKPLPHRNSNPESSIP